MSNLLETALRSTLHNELRTMSAAGTMIAELVEKLASGSYDGDLVDYVFQTPTDVSIDLYRARAFAAVITTLLRHEYAVCRLRLDESAPSDRRITSEPSTLREAYPEITR